MTMDEQGRLMSQARKDFWGSESGAVAVIVAIVLVVALGAGALALDIAHLVSVKRELAKAAEAGALSGARALWPQDFSTATSRDPDCTGAASMALTTVTKNRVESVNLAADEVSVQVGRWNYAAKVFTPGIGTNANGVRVTASRANVNTILAQILGQGPRNMSASAVAIMDFATAVGKGCLPIAVNQDYAKTPHITIYIGFNPDAEDNGGWFAVSPESAAASVFKSYIENDSCPPLNIGDPIALNNGCDTSVLQLLSDELANHPGGWVVFLPVVDTPKFNQQDNVDAFVPVKITEVKKTGDPKYVKGEVMTAAEAASALPGGGNFGALAPPKLVQ
jgi:Flp pilus assembly protein TadG